MVVSHCLECGQPIELGGKLVEGQRITCANCRAKLEILCLKPLELDWAYDEPCCPWAEGTDHADKLQ